MDRETGKRRAGPSSSDRKSRSGPRGNKIRKTNNDPEATQAETQIQTQFPMEASKQAPPVQDSTQATTHMQVQAQSNRRTQNPDLVQKLVAAWIGGSQGQHSLMTQECVRDSITLRDYQQQCSEAENMIQMFQEKLKSAEAVIANLKQALRAEGQEKMDLIHKMNATGQLTASISDHINYITDTLGRCQQHQKHLSKLYNTVTVKQKEDYAKLTNREEQLRKHSVSLQNKVATLEKHLHNARQEEENKWNQMQRAYEADFSRVSVEYENAKKQLDVLGNEKNEIANRLAREKKITLNLENKINEYDNEIKKLTEKLTQAFENIRSFTDEKTKWEVQLEEKDRNLLQISEELDSATKKITELSTKLSEINGVKNELEEKLKCEVNERETMSKSLTARIEELTGQVERLRESKDEAVKELQRSKEEAMKEMERSKEKALTEMRRSKEEAVNYMQKKIEIAEKETQRIFAESKNGNYELVQKYERMLKDQQEKYENCVAEIRTMEIRHKCELSRANTSSSTEVANANMEKRLMERELDKLRREKDRIESQFRQTEDLLLQHTKSESLLQKKLDEAQSEATHYASAAAKATAEKKRVDADKDEKIRKIKELEQELLNLKFNNAKSTQNEAAKIDAVKEDQRNKDRAKPTVVSSTVVKKSILKRTPTKTYTSKVRKTRSTPPSPIKMQPPPTTDKKITFDLDSASDSSPVKLDNPGNVNKFINSESLFDDIVATAKSSSQPMQTALASSQTSMSQGQSGGRKFFKSRNSRGK